MRRSALALVPLQMLVLPLLAYAESDSGLDQTTGAMVTAMSVMGPALGVALSTALLGEMLATFVSTEVVGALLSAAISTGAAGGVAGFIAMNIVTITAVAFVLVSLASIGIIAYHVIPALSQAVADAATRARGGGADPETGSNPGGAVGCCGMGVDEGGGFGTGFPEGVATVGEPTISGFVDVNDPGLNGPAPNGLDGVSIGDGVGISVGDGVGIGDAGVGVGEASAFLVIDDGAVGLDPQQAIAWPATLVMLLVSSLVVLWPRRLARA